MKFTRFIILALATLTVADHAQEASEADFTPIFDGETFEGWEHHGNWIVEYGAFYRKENGGSLTYTAANVPDDFGHLLPARSG